MNHKLAHPCKRTCSGWDHGLSTGKEFEKERASILVDALSAIQRGLTVNQEFVEKMTKDLATDALKEYARRESK